MPGSIKKKYRQLAAAASNKGCTSLVEPLFFQPKLTINPPNDVYEQEADAVAENIIHSPGRDAGKGSFFPSATSVQKKCAACEATEEEQRGNGTTVDAANQQYIHTLGGGRPLSGPQRQFFESALGISLSRVQLHTNEAANASAHQLGAKAYTWGNHIVFAKNGYQPETEEGKKLLAHELTHVGQQQHGGKQVQREEAKKDRYEALKEEKSAKEIFEKLNPDTLGRYCTQNCPAVAEALEEYLKTGIFPSSKCDPLGEGSYGYDISESNFSAQVTGWDKFFKTTGAKLKKHGDFLVIEAERTDKQAADNNLTKWHYFLILNIKGKNFVVDAFTKEVNADIGEYAARLKATQYRYVDGDFKLKKVRVNK